MVLEIIIAGSVGAAIGAIGMSLIASGKIAEEHQVNTGLNFILVERANRITALEKEVHALREAEARAAKVRSAIARAGGIARGMQQRKIADQKANAARDRTIGSLVSAPLRPREEVVAGAREARRDRAQA